MSETIEVRYLPLLGGLYYHKYVVYTDNSGNQYAVRGGPETGISGSVSRSSSGHSGSGTGFGRIIIDGGSFNSDFIDHPDNPSRGGSGGNDPSEIIKTGEDLSADWDSIKQAMIDIANAKYDYSPLSQNSNATVDKALADAGLPAPQQDDAGEYRSPGSDASLTNSSTSDLNGDGFPDSPLLKLLPWLPVDPVTLIPPISPLVLDVNFSGSIDLSSLGDYGTYFDTDANGQAELTGWITGGDGVLAIDLNANGKIDNGLELFGTAGGAEDGFAALRLYDTNSDGQVTSADTQWDDLLVWVDTNMDGVSQEGELHTLDYFNITAISLAAELLNDEEIAGNQITHEASFTTSDGLEYSIVDAWFDNSAGITRNDEDYDFDFRVAFLPTLRGFGDLKDLHIAASIDNTGAGNLMDMLADLATSFTGLEVFDDWENFETDVENLLLKWAGVDGVDPESRGTHVDARHLEFYEAFTGAAYTQYNQPNPRIEAGAQIEAIFSYIKIYFANQLAAQIFGGDIFEDAPNYSLFSGAIEGDMVLSQDGLDAIEALAIASSSSETVWTRFAQFIGYTKGLDNLTTAEISMLNDAVDDTNEPSLDDWSDVVSRMVATLGSIIEDSEDFGSFEVAYDNPVFGTNSADTLTGLNNSNDVMSGENGNDTIYGLSGHDKISGGSGNDIINGGVGDDYLLGGVGDDTYIYLIGNDTFDENSSGGNDRIEIEASTGLTTANIADVYRAGANLVVQLSTGDILTLDGHYVNSASRIEELKFLSDNSSVNLINIVDLKTYGTVANDEITSTSLASSNVIYGYGGNDKLIGNSNADTLYGGSGVDFLDGLGGTDSLYGGTGDDRVEGGSGNDTLHGDAGDDRLFGEGNDDTLYGGSGDDYLDGGTGNDILDGGDGNDRLKGSGATYMASNGHDQIANVEGVGTIVMQTGVDLEDLTISRILTDEYEDFGTSALSDNLLISWGSNSITVGAQYTNSAGGSSSGYVRYIEFSDTTVLDLSTLIINPVGTSGDDYIHLSNYPTYEPQSTEPATVLAELNYEVYAYGGNDVLAGAYGDDSLYGGSGDDTYYLSYGHDTILDSSGHDIINLAIYEYYNRPEILDFHNFSATVQINDDVTIGFIDDSSYSVTLTDQADTATTARLEEMVAFDRVVDITDIGTWIFGTVDNLTPETINGNIHSGIVNDFIFGYSGEDHIYGLSGNDQIYAGDGDDYIEGGDGNDYIEGHLGNDEILGGAGNDTLIGGDGSHELYGGSGNDVLEGGEGNDILEGGTDNDEYQATSGDDVIADASGTDSLYLSSYVTDDLTFTNVGTYNVEITFAGSTDSILITDHRNSGDTKQIEQLIVYGDAAINFSAYGTAAWITGTSSGEAISGDTGSTQRDDNIFGLAGADTLNGLLGSDRLFGGYGHDTLNGGSGNDYLYGEGDDDVLKGGAGNDILNGGDGIDTANYSASSAAVEIDLQNGTASGGDAAGDTLVSIENIIGSDTNNNNIRDFIWGDDQNNAIYGLSGYDVLEGGGGEDIIDGGTGWDYARYLRSASGVSVNLATNVNTGGDAEGDLLYGIEAVVGSTHNDTLIGGSANDYLKGDAGNDYLYGGAGYNQLYGEAGNDTYLFSSGTGAITETTGTDRLIFDDMWSPEDIIINDNFLSFIGSADSITFNDITLIEEFEFDGHAVMNLATLQTYNPPANTTGDSGDNVFYATTSAENFSGLEGIDTVDYSASLIGVKVDLQAGTGTQGDAAGDTYTSIENVTGSNIYHITGSDTSLERDTIYGNSYSNHIRGLAGNDILEGGGGNDLIDGSDGWDYARYTRSDAAVQINLLTNINTGGHAEGDSLANIEAVTGSNYNDTIIGGNGADYLTGGLGNDFLSGGSGVDDLFGSEGADTFWFDPANAFSNIDKIRDFSVSQNDKIDIADLLSGYDPLTDAITDFVEITDNGTHSFLKIDIDGGANNFVQIAQISNVIGLTNEEALETSGNLVTV